MSCSIWATLIPEIWAVPIWIILQKFKLFIFKNPAIFVLPFTSNFSVGFVVPIPTFPKIAR